MRTFHNLKTMMTSSRKILGPRFYHSMAAKCLYPSITVFSSVGDKKCKKIRDMNKQYVISVKRFCLKHYQRLSETPPCSKSRTVCSVQRGNGTSKKPVHYRFHPETETALNQQINAELKASYYYLSMASYFGQVDVALPGCESYFMHMHQEEHEHALKLLNYIKTRGGCINLCAINPPNEQNWRCPLHAFETALDLEISITDDLVAVNGVAEKHGDLNASDFIITNFIDDQMKSVCEIARFVTVLSGIGNQGLGQFIFDRDLWKNYVPQDFNVLRKS